MRDGECKQYAPVTAHLHAIFSPLPDSAPDVFMRAVPVKKNRTIVLRAMVTTLPTPTRRSPLPQQPTLPPSIATDVRQPHNFTCHSPLEANCAQWGREYGRLPTHQQFCPDNLIQELQEAVTTRIILCEGAKREFW